MKLHCHYLNKDTLYTLYRFIILHYILLHDTLQYTLHYITLHYITLQYTTLSYTSLWITLHSSALHDLIYISVQNSKNWNWIGRPSTTAHEFVFAWSIANTMFHIQEFISQFRVIGLRKEVWSQKYLTKLGPTERLGCRVLFKRTEAKFSVWQGQGRVPEKTAQLSPSRTKLHKKSLTGWWFRRHVSPKATAEVCQAFIRPRKRQAKKEKQVQDAKHDASNNATMQLHICEYFCTFAMWLLWSNAWVLSQRFTK